VWVTDGTVSGTFRLVTIPGADCGTGCAPRSRPSGFVELGGRVHFVAAATAGFQLWSTDGTPAGTGKVADLPGPTTLQPVSFQDPFRDYLVRSGSALYFPANSSAAGAFVGDELWRSDGTAAGTGLVADLNPGPGSSDPYALTDVAGTLFFTAYTPAFGREIWKSNGSAASTTLVADLRPGPGQPYYFDGPLQLTAVGNTLYFVGYCPPGPPCKSDGTAVGTTGYLVGKGATWLARLDDSTLVFADQENNGELWRTGGSSATSAFIDINPGFTPSYPYGVTVADGVAYFATQVGANAGVWRSDTTEAGTSRLGAAISYVDGLRFVASGDFVFFAGQSAGTLEEGLFAVPRTPGGFDCAAGEDVSPRDGIPDVAADCMTAGALDVGGHLIVSGLGGPPGDERISVSGRVRVPTVPAFDPSARGLRLVIGTGDGLLADLTVPAAGWTGSGALGRWRYRIDPFRVDLRERPPGSGDLRIRLRGRGAIAGLAPPFLFPLRLGMLEDAPAVRTDCGNVAFTSNDCRVSAAGSRVRCR
jgi:ELWxxDGT repeat protein